MSTGHHRCGQKTRAKRLHPNSSLSPCCAQLVKTAGSTRPPARQATPAVRACIARSSSASRAKSRARRYRNNRRRVESGKPSECASVRRIPFRETSVHCLRDAGGETERAEMSETVKGWCGRDTVWAETASRPTFQQQCAASISIDHKSLKRTDHDGEMLVKSNRYL